MIVARSSTFTSWRTLPRQSRAAMASAVPKAGEMVQRLRSDLQDFRGKVRAGVDTAEEAGDRGTANLLDPVIDHLDKEIWMLQAFLAE